METGLGEVVMYAGVFARVVIRVVIGITCTHIR